MQDVLSAHDTPIFWKSVLLLVVWLYAVFQLPYRACDLILRYISVSARKLNAFSDDFEPITTLYGAFRQLDLDDSIVYLPMCKKCRKVFPHDVVKDAVCTKCSQPLFDLSSSIPNAKAKPFLKLPYNPLSQQLSKLLKQQGIEEVLDSWRTRKRTPG